MNLEKLAEQKESTLPAYYTTLNFVGYDTKRSFEKCVLTLGFKPAQVVNEVRVKSPHKKTT